jgi:DNA helicase-2/ATP-dependent DNA helicase PcrA
LRQEKENLSVSALIMQVLEKTGYTKNLESQKTIEANNRVENLEEFLTVAMEFEEEFAENSLSDFLESITLSSDIDNLEEETEKVTLMTLHSSKGLEFPVVFLVRNGGRHISGLQVNRRTWRIGRRTQIVLCGYHKGKGIFIFDMQ